MKPKYVEDFATAECQCCSPDCDKKQEDHIYLVPRCHPHNGVRMRYCRKTETMEVICDDCGAHVVTVRVAHKDKPYEPNEGTASKN